MTPQESTMLNDLVRKVQGTQLQEKDDEAERLLQQSLGSNPDAMYILAQAVLVQNIALDRAKAQVEQLQQQVQQAQEKPAHSTSFLGSLLGRNEPPPPPPQNFAPRPAAPPAQYYPPAPAYGAPDYSAGPPSAAQSGGGSSFLRSAATTAAGVAAGALAFQGVESLLHGFGHGGGGFGGSAFGGGFGGGGFGERPVEETVINNYYDDPNQSFGGMGDHHEHEASFDDRPGDRFADPQGIDTLDADQTTGGLDDDTSSLDDTSLDDSSLDDSGGFDDGGGFDSGDDSSLA